MWTPLTSGPDPGRIARTPEPPYTAVIFTSLHSGNADGYARMATRMFGLAAEQPGYLGHESVSEQEAGITVSYWTDHTDGSRVEAGGRAPRRTAARAGRLVRRLHRADRDRGA